jgi:predicted transcriptional regulator
MDKITQILRHSGLSKNQSKVYVSILNKGMALVSDIAKHTELKRPTVYQAIGGLEILGLIAKTEKGKRMYYSVVHPKRLEQLMNLRKRELEDIIPTLVSIHATTTQKPRVQMFEGEDAVKNMYREIFEQLNRKSEGLFMGNIDAVIEHFPKLSEIYAQYLFSVPNPKIREIVYNTPGAQKWSLHTKKVSHGENHRIRLLPTTFGYGKTDYMLINNILYIFSFKNDIIITRIESSDIAETQTAIFEWLWTVTIPLE